MDLHKMQVKENIEPVKRIIDAGSNMTGTVTSNILTFLVGGTEGAIVGGMAGATVTGVVKVLGDIAHRNLSKREEIGIGAAANFAIDKIRARLESGEMPRDDRFFTQRDYDSRSYAEEIFEWALLKSKNEHEEKKIKFIANIFSNTTFHSEISSSEANHILQVAENMTYRQMCLIALFERIAEFDDIHLATKDLSIQVNKDDTSIVDNLSVLQEIYQLSNSGLVACKLIEQVNAGGFTDSSITNSQNYMALFSLDDVIPDMMVLTSLGKRYYSIMNLNEISSEDLVEVVEILSN